MTTAPVKSIPKTTQTEASGTETWKVVLPYGLALLAQLPMLILYFRKLWILPHYQPFAIAILATVGIALYRWPFDQQKPFRKSITSDILLVLGLGCAFLGMLFVEPWFAALSSMLIVTSLFVRTVDRETGNSLWPCALPLFVYLTLPNSLDIRLITTLQRYSAIYTSRLLDLFGLGHHMDGTVIKVPSASAIKEYGIEQACSGVQSFFTLLLVAVVFIVLSRRVKVPKLALGFVAIMASALCFVIWMAIPAESGWSPWLLLTAVGLLLFSFVGFRAAALVLSAVFWAMFMNTLRILSIPLADNMFGMDLTHGIAHDVLGYLALGLGILMIFSTDQFLLFLFGPVDAASGESGPIGRSITRFWNSVLSSTEESDSETQRKQSPRQKSMTKLERTFVWIAAGLMVAMGLFQVVDVQRSLAQTDLRVRFFDADVTVDYQQDDISEFVGSDDGKNPWKRIQYEVQDRSIGSDLGQRSDVWQFRSPTCAAVASLDQTFPGWHELTTCYRNQGWILKSRTRRTPEQVLGESAADNNWPYIEATFEKKTGEKGYLLFSHFDAFGEGIDAPSEWNSINSFMIRARNRLSHRIRSSLFRGEVYQTQVFLSSFEDLPEPLKLEVNERYLKIREQLRIRFQEKKQQLNDEETGNAA